MTAVKKQPPARAIARAMTPAQFQHAMLAWFDQSGRKDLPWQHDITPYRVWVSEIMLQQTQVATVIPYFERFIGRLPTVAALAAASEDEVLHLWTGLGYYSRARNLRRSAQLVVNDHGGAIPDSLEQLLTLPGIGRSTAGAILSIAHGQPAAILDGNVKRVLARYFAIPGWPGRSQVASELWELAERYTPEHRAGHYTQAMMDLGATRCTRARPHCGSCPLSDSCSVLRSGDVALYPGKKPKKDTPLRRTRMLIIENQHGEILLHKRPPTGVWGGLWLFPEVPPGSDPGIFCGELLHTEIVGHVPWKQHRHTFSHFRLDIEPVHVKIRSEEYSISEDRGAIWYRPNAPQSIGLASPVVKLLQQLDSTLQ